MSKQLIASYVRDLEPFPVDNRGFYHNIMSLIISQRIRFKQAQRIRLNIYQVLNDFKLDNVMSLTFEQRKQCKLNDDKWQIMKRFHDMKEDNLHSIHGIGKWTVDCAKIMTGDYTCGFITGDLAVRKELSRILDLPKTLTSKEAGIVMKDFDTCKAGLIFSKLWNKTRSY